MRDNLVEQIISDVMNKQTDISPEAKTAANFAGCGITEFVGTALGHTIGLVIANVDKDVYKRQVFAAVHCHSGYGLHHSDVTALPPGYAG